MLNDGGFNSVSYFAVSRHVVIVPAPSAKKFAKRSFSSLLVLVLLPTHIVVCSAIITGKKYSSCFMFQFWFVYSFASFIVIE